MAASGERSARRLIDFDGAQPAIEVVECGDPHGRPVLFFHGWPMAASQCLVFDDAALRASIRLVGASRPGTGRSAPDPVRSVAEWAKRVPGLADALGFDRFGLLGVSGGGPYALATAAALSGRVEACAVVSCAPPIGPEGARRLSPWLRTELAIRRQAPRVAEAALVAARIVVRRRLFVWAVSARWAWRVPREVEAMRVPAAASAFRAASEALSSSASALAADADRLASPWGFTAAAIRVPVCFWHGAFDRTSPWPLVEPIAASIPGARIVVGEADGHHSMSRLRTPEIVGWLRDAYRGGIGRLPSAI
jgi:pimeloyl-ACP methyl ester carboxylesterase